jgi:hypothetical protein
MVSEMEIITTFLFKRSGKSKQSFSELYLTLSMDLNWFTPEDAKEFVNSAIKQKLLTKKGESITPNFDYDKIVVPVGFYPSREIFEEKKEETMENEEDVLSKIVRRIAEKTKLNDKEILEKIQATVKEKNITIEVAALLIGKNYDIKIDDFIDEIEKMF